MKSKILHRSLSIGALLLWFCVNPGCAQIGGIESPTDDKCANGLRDTGEDGIDCGGACPLACPGTRCTKDNECASSKCDKNACAAPSCTDGIWNGVESSTDTCPASWSCVAQRCRPDSCFDAASNMTPNGDETGLDCGGPRCGACNGAACKVNTECASQSCVSGVCACAHCSAVIAAKSEKISEAVMCHPLIYRELVNCTCGPVGACRGPCGEWCNNPSMAQPAMCLSCIKGADAMGCGTKYMACMLD